MKAYNFDELAARLAARQQEASQRAQRDGLQPAPLYGPRARKAAQRTDLRREWVRLAARQARQFNGAQS